MPPQPNDLDDHLKLRLELRFKNWEGVWFTVYGFDEMFNFTFDVLYDPERVLLFVIRTRVYLREGVYWGEK